MLNPYPNPYIIKLFDSFGSIINSWPLLILITIFIFRSKISIIMDILIEKIKKAKTIEYNGLKLTDITLDEADTKTTISKAQGMIDPLGTEAKQIISSLWFYQQQRHKDNPLQRVAYKAFPQKTKYRQEYLDGITELNRKKLIDINDEYYCYLTNLGLKYCKDNPTSLINHEALWFKFQF